MAGVFYIDNSVAPGGDGSFANPWDELSAFLPLLNPGDTCFIRVGTGTYNEGEVAINVSGTAGNPITIEVYPGEAVVWNAGAADDIFDIDGDYITLSGFELDLRNQGDKAIDLKGDNNIIDACEIHASDFGQMVHIRGSNNTIQDCELYDTFNGNANDAQGISIRGPTSTGTIITGCTIYDCRGDCIQVNQLGGAVGDVLIDNCILYTTLGNCSENGIDIKAGRVIVQDCTLYGFDQPCDATCGGSGSPRGQAITAHQITISLTISGCEIYDCEAGIYCSANFAAELYKNSIHDMVDNGGADISFIRITNSPSADIYNNTLANHASGVSLIWGASTGTFTNNIVEGANNIDDDAGPPTASYNCWWNVIDTWSGTGDVLANPLFENEGAQDYTLQNTSPCIDAGIFVGLPFFGGAPDMGAFEFPGGPPPQPASVVTAPGPFGEALGFSPFTPTSHEAQGVAIIAYKPSISSYTLPGSLVDDQLGQKFTGYTHTTMADGGWWSARLSLNGSLVDMEDWFDQGLGRHIEVYNPALAQVWGGFVNRVTLSAGTLSATTGPLLDIANRASVTYAPILDATTDPPVIGAQTTTTIAEDADSQARYGIIEQILNGGQLLDDGTTNLAEERRDTFISDNAWPKSTEDLGLGSTSEPVVELDLLGYIHWFGVYILDDPTAATVTVSDPDGTGKLQLIIAADPNGLFSTDYSQMEDNALLTSRYEQDNRDGWTAIQELVALGDAANNRALFGVYANRRVHYNTIPTTVKYQHRIADRDIQVEPYGGGAEIKPWDIPVGEWILLPDFLVGRSQSSVLRRDPRNVFIESVTFTAPYTVQIKGGSLDTISQLIAKGGMWG